MPKPKLYEGIKLLLADPEKQFPEEFDPEHPLKVKFMVKLSQQSFIRTVERVDGTAVVALEDFNPRSLLEETLDDVELRDGATYIVIPRESKTIEKRFEGIEAWQKNQTDGSERKLVQQTMKYLEDNGHTNVRPFCRKIVTGPGGLKREIDAAAIADACAVVILHKNLMDVNGADQLIELVRFINSWKDKGKGSVVEFSGKRIIGVLTGPTETNNASNKTDMDSILDENNFLKWFDRGDDPCRPFPASGASCDAPMAPTDSPGNGTNAPAAMPRRGKPQAGLFNGMQAPAMLVRPRLANRPAGFRSCF